MYQTTARISNELNKDIKIAAINSNIQIQYFIEKLIKDNQDKILEIIKNRDIELLKILNQRKDKDIGFLLSKEVKEWIKNNHFKTKEVAMVAFYIFQKSKAKLSIESIERKI